MEELEEALVKAKKALRSPSYNRIRKNIRVCKRMRILEEERGKEKAKFPNLGSADQEH